MENEPVIALDVCNEVERSGHRVICARDASEALSLCEQQRPAFALLNFFQHSATDNLALAGELQQRFGMDSIFLTGARPQDLKFPPPLQPTFPMLAKPFSRHQLREALRSLFAAASNSA